MAMKKEPIVSLVKSTTCVYDEVDFKNMVQQSLENLETNGVAVPSEGTVFIKPSMVIEATARESITTEPRFVSSLITLLKDRGVKQIYVGDSSASFIRSKDTFKTTGMDEAVKGVGGQIVNIDDPAERTEIALHDSDMLASITVPTKALEADCLINFGKLKTHRVGAMTCCVKNWVGFIPQDVRLRYHQTRLPKLVAELHRALPEHLCFGDGIIIGEGDGPDISKPRFLGVLLAANDPVALDSIASELLNVSRNELIHPWTAYFEGVGEIERNKITVIGPDIRSMSIQIEAPVEVLYNRFPANIVLGGMCEGCFAWFIGPALFWERDGLWKQINENVGRPTFMIGFNADDLNFEKHIEEGPYFVIGDCAPAKYRNHSKTVYIEGCCPGPKIPEIILNTCKMTETIWSD